MVNKPILTLKRNTSVASKPRGAETSNFSKPKQVEKVQAYHDLGRVMNELRKMGYKVRWKEPLSKDIYQEIRAVLPKDFISSRALYDAIGYLVKSIKYLLKMRDGAFRYNLAGKKAGTVTAEESKFALQELLNHHGEYMRERRQRAKKIITAHKPSRSGGPHGKKHGKNL